MMPDWPWPRSYRYLCEGLQSQGGDLGLFVCCDLDFCGGIVLHPAPQLSQHGFGRSARGTNDEDVAELQRVFAIALVERTADAGWCICHARLFALRPFTRVCRRGRSIALANLRVVRECLEPVVL